MNRYVLCNRLIASPQTHHVCSTLKQRENGRFHVVSTWNKRGVFLGLMVSRTYVEDVLRTYEGAYLRQYILKGKPLDMIYFAQSTALSLIIRFF